MCAALVAHKINDFINRFRFELYPTFRLLSTRAINQHIALIRALSI